MPFVYDGKGKPIDNSESQIWYHGSPGRGNQKTISVKSDSRDDCIKLFNLHIKGLMYD
jgi:hypothetical protein